MVSIKIYDIIIYDIKNFQQQNNQIIQLPNIFYFQKKKYFCFSHQKNISYLINQMSYYSSSSTYRKDQQLSSRYKSKNQPTSTRQQLSETTRNINIQKQNGYLQQQQIADLQRKIDLILMHNEKLQSQKQRYRIMYEQVLGQNTQRTYQSNTARFITQENQIVISKLRKQLQMSSKTYERRINQAYQSKQILKEQIQTLSKIIDQINEENRQLKLNIKQQALKIQSLTFQLKEQFIRQQAELQNRLRDQFLIREIQLKNQKKQLMDIYQEKIQQLKQKFNQEKQQIQKKHDEIFRKMIQQNQRDKQALRKQLYLKFQNQKQLFLQQNRQELKRQQDKARQFINANLHNLQSNDQEIKKQYQQEIKRLRQSLQARKKLIDTLLSHNSNSIAPSQSQNQNQLNSRQSQQNQIRNNLQTNQASKFSSQISWFNELMALKRQMQHLTNQYLQQSQLLKLKLTQKFQIDVKQLKKIYQDKIQLMALHNQRMQDQNSRLRNSYQNALQVQIQIKKDFQLQKSRLKNLIRKLKVELNGIQEEFRINIQGVKDQNNTFSMTMMKSMLEVKQKANFFTQQNRKLRKAYEQNQQHTQQAVKQSQQKVRYYQNKYQSLKQKLNLIVNQYKQKFQIIQLESEERENNLRDNLNKEHEMIHSVVEGLRKDVDNLTSQNHDLKKRCHDLTCTFKQKDEDIAFYKSKVDQLQADIQRLKMDLQMAGVNDKDTTDTINQWRNHYETIVTQLQQQKGIMNEKILQKDQQLVSIVKKYKILQFQLEKTVKALQKRSLIQKRVLQIGTDTNLVKNLAQLFTNQEKFSA